jgi:hypothetical protein
VLGAADHSGVLPADFIIPFENNYAEIPPPTTIELRSLNLYAPTDSVHTTPTEEKVFTPFTEDSRAPEIHNYPASITFSVSSAPEGPEKEYIFALSSDVNFVTAHPCAPSQKVKFVRSPSSPTIQQIDVSGDNISEKSVNTANITGEYWFSLLCLLHGILINLNYRNT